MTVQTPPYVQQGQTHTAALFRQELGASLGLPAATLFAGGVSATTAGGAHGVVGANDLAVSQDTGANMNSSVAKGFGYISGTENASQGTYLGYNDAAALQTHSASDPTNPRRDLVVMKVRDAFYSGASTDVSLAVVTGTPNAVPVDPTPPANALVLARVAIPAASTAVTNANITNLRTYASAVGGFGITTTANRPTGASVYEGLGRVDIDTNSIIVHSGAAFSTVGPVYGGWTNYTPNWTSSGVAPTIGNGAIAGGYQRFGRDVLFRFSILIGSTTTVGTGTYFISCPFTALGVTQMGMATFVDASTGFWTHLDAYLPASSSTMQFPLGNTTVNQWGAATPAAPAVNDVLVGWISYEAAADA